MYPLLILNSQSSLHASWLDFSGLDNPFSGCAELEMFGVFITLSCFEEKSAKRMRECFSHF